MDKPKRNKKKQISYVEVDSDVDLPSDEERKFEDQLVLKVNKRRKSTNEDDSDVEDTTKTTTTVEKKKESEKSTTRKKKQKYDSKMLLALPFDLFAELCTHLDYKDLISLAKVNKSLHKILLSRAARPIWAGIRKRDGFPLLDDMSEIKFAILLVGTSCEGCGTRSHLSRSLFLRNCLCKECLPNFVIASNRLKSKWPELHPRAIECVRFDQGWLTKAILNTSRLARFLISELSEVNTDVLDAQAEDEIVEMALENQQRRESSSRRRQTGPVESAEPEVESLEKASRAAVKVLAVEKELREAIEQREKEAWKRKVEARQNLFLDYALEFEDLDWCEDDVLDLVLPFLRNSANPPKVSPSSDPQQWSRYLGRINARGRDYISNRELEQSLQPFWDSLKLTESPRHSKIFPTLTEFQHFKAIRSWLEDKKPKPLTKSLWLKMLPSLLDELAGYYKSIRIEAIRSVLAAQQGVHITKISKSPTLYSESLYPDSFFDLATSLFPPRWNTFQDLSSYPEVAMNGSGSWKGKGTLGRRAQSRTTLTIQAIIGAAGLEASSATAVDLDALGRRFTWDNDTRGDKRDTLRTWREVERDVRKRGSDNMKFQDGSATTIVSYFPQVDVDGMTYLDDEGDVPGDESDGGEEEGEEGECRRRGGNDSETEDGGEHSETNDTSDAEEDYEG
ncbi:hypothetical protein JCM3765_000251 [Sporobolomyces pararoseus]